MTIVVKGEFCKGSVGRPFSLWRAWDIPAGEWCLAAAPGRLQDRAGGRDDYNATCSASHPNGGNAMMAYLPIHGSQTLANFPTFDDFT